MPPRPSRNYPRSKLLAGLPTSLQLYTIAEVAIILDTDIHSVYQWIGDGRLPSVRLGNEKHFIRVRVQDLENFIDAYIRNGNINLTEPEKKISGSEELCQTPSADTDRVSIEERLEEPPR